MRDVVAFYFTPERSDTLNKYEQLKAKAHENMFKKNITDIMGDSTFFEAFNPWYEQKSLFLQRYDKKALLHQVIYEEEIVTILEEKITPHLHKDEYFYIYSNNIEHAVMRTDISSLKVNFRSLLALYNNELYVLCREKGFLVEKWGGYLDSNPNPPEYYLEIYELQNV